MKPRTADELAAWLAQEDAINASCQCPSWWDCPTRGCYTDAKDRYAEPAPSPRYDSSGDLYGGRMADESSARNHPAVKAKPQKKPEFPL